MTQSSTTSGNLVQWANEQVKATGGPVNVLSISPEMVHFCDGNLKYAAFLTHLLFWTKHSRKQGWIYKSWRDWFTETALVEKDIAKARAHFEERGLLETKLKKANGVPTVHYKVDGSAFTAQFKAFLTYRESEEWNPKNGRIRFSHFRDFQSAKIGKSSNRKNDRLNNKKNVQNSPKPPQGAKGRRRALVPPLEDPMCQAIVKVAGLDPIVSKRRIQTLAHKLRQGGYQSTNIFKIPEMVSRSWGEHEGKVQLVHIENFIFDTLTEDEKEMEVRPATICVFYEGEPRECSWNDPFDAVKYDCRGCSNPIHTVGYAANKTGNGKSSSYQNLYCTPECLKAHRQ